MFASEAEHLKDKKYVYQTKDGTKYLFTRTDVMRNEIFRYGNILVCEDAKDYMKYFTPNTTVLDIGAHFGGFSIWSARNFPSISIHSWEPQKRLFLELCANIALNDLEDRIFPYDKACGEYESIGWYLATDYKTDVNPGVINVCIAPPDQNLHKPTKIETIDKKNLNDISVMKIDVEGMELSVLRGAEQTIKRCMPLIFMESWENNSARPMAIQQLRSMGYTNIIEIGDELIAVPEKPYGA